MNTKKKSTAYGPDGWKRESNEKYKSDATEQLKEWALKSLTQKFLMIKI